MIVEVTEKFLADIDRLRDKKIKERLDKLIDLMEKASSLSELPHLKKLKGYSNAYRLRVGNYRAGFLFEDGKIKLGRFLSRPDIYRKFP